MSKPSATKKTGTKRKAATSRKKATKKKTAHSIAEQIFASEPRRRVPLHVDLGQPVTLFCRIFEREDLIEIQRLVGDGDPGVEAMAKIARMSIVDESGAEVFAEKHVAQLVQLPYTTIALMLTEILRANGLWTET